MERISRDDYFMSLAESSAKRSKDPHTQVGACLVRDNHVLSLGYNGAPRSFPDELVPTERDTTKPLPEQKYPYIVHAELNSILNYRGDLVNLYGSTCYVTVSPCYECAKALIQIGVKEIVYKELYHREDIVNMADILFKACHIKVRKLD